MTDSCLPAPAVSSGTEPQAAPAAKAAAKAGGGLCNVAAVRKKLRAAALQAPPESMAENRKAVSDFTSSEDILGAQETRQGVREGHSPRVDSDGNVIPGRTCGLKCHLRDGGGANALATSACSPQ